MSKGVIIIKEDRAFIAVNTPAKPKEEGYFDLQETHFDQSRYDMDVAYWQSIVDQAELIELDNGNINCVDFERHELMKSHGKKVDYSFADGRNNSLKLMFKIEAMVTMDSVKILKQRHVTTGIYFIVSRYNEDVSWVDNYVDEYKSAIFNKGEYWPGYNVYAALNYGGNQYDICKYIMTAYDRLPDLICFVQGFPFDHCHEDVFRQLINNTSFTALESYGGVPEGEYHKKDVDGGYMELNNSWYIAAHNEKLLSEGKEITCKFDSYDDFMHSLFSDYQPLEWIRFTPGSQYIVTKQDCLRYSKDFWKKLMDFLPKTNVNGGTEAHLLERALFYIFKGKYTERA